jgi:hypothetical protein
LTLARTWHVALERVVVLLYRAPDAVVVAPQACVLYRLCQRPQALYVPPSELIQLLQGRFRLLLADDQALQQVREVLRAHGCGAATGDVARLMRR